MATLRIVSPVAFRWNGKQAVKLVTLVTETLDNPQQAKNLMLDFRGENCAPPGETATVFHGIYTEKLYF